MKLKLFIGLALLLGSLGAAHAESLAEVQSLCAKDAAAFMTRQKQLDHPGDVERYSYENHYSESMKSCFIVITDVIYWSEVYPNDKAVSVRHRLFDVYDNRLLGGFSKVNNQRDLKTRDLKTGLQTCGLGGVECSCLVATRLDPVQEVQECEDEWRAKVQPYVPGWKYLF